ncbi:hypothetical protein CBL_05050 [Carabus blaptoides fortunei]
MPATQHSKISVAAPSNTNRHPVRASKIHLNIKQKTITKELPSEESLRPQPKVKKPPPIHLLTKDGWPELQHQLRQSGAEIVITKNRRDYTQVQVASADQFHAATRQLDALQVPNHTYSLPEERSIRAVIKGIPEGISCEAIKRELEEEISVISVTRFRSRAHKSALPLVLVQVPRNGGLSKFSSRPQPSQQQAHRPRPSPIIPGKSYAASAAANLSKATKDRTQRQTSAPVTGDLQPAGLINEALPECIDNLYNPHHNLARYEADADMTNIEATAVIINMTSGPLRLTSVYKGSNKLLLDSELDQLLSANEPTILAGELNSKHPSWNSHLTNTSARKLRAFADRYDVVVYGLEDPTFFHAAGYRPDALDVLVTKNVTMNIELATRTTTHRKICWPKYKDTAENTITCSPPLTTVPELQLAVDVTKCIQDAIVCATRITNKSATKNKITDETKELIRRKNQARRAWQRHDDIAARATMNQLARQQLDIDEQSPRRIARALRQKRKSVPPIHSQARLVYSDEDKAKAFADRLELQTSLNSNLGDIARMKHVESYTSRILNKIDRTSLKHVTPKNTKLIKKLSPKKAPGPDNIPHTALKNLGRQEITALTNILNAALRLRHFPLAHIRRKIQSTGLSTKYGQDENLCILMRHIGSLAFLPSMEIPEAFNELKTYYRRRP